MGYRSLDEAKRMVVDRMRWEVDPTKDWDSLIRVHHRRERTMVRYPWILRSIGTCRLFVVHAVLIRNNLSQNTLTQQNRYWRGLRRSRRCWDWSRRGRSFFGYEEVRLFRAAATILAVLLPAVSILSCRAPADDLAVQNGFSVRLEDPTGSGEHVFDPADLEFSSGETVTIALTSEREFHTFTVAELDIDIAVNAGETKAFVVTFDEPGSYRLICIPHEALGMTGTITVR